jgi:hypothetical protein
MTARSRSKPQRHAPFLRLAYSAPAALDAAEGDIRRFTMPATKALPFVRRRANDQPLWCPESYWHVKPTGNRSADLRLGRKYARLAIAAMKADGNRQLIAYIIQDIVRDAIERPGTRARVAYGSIARGFLAELSEAIASS